MASVLALSSAAILGVGDFLGGLVSKRSGPVAMVIVLQIIGVPTMVVLAAVVGPHGARGVDLAWGSAAGLAGGAGIGLLYLGLASGAMSAVAPVTAVCAASVPVVFGLLVGERASPPAGLGIVLALVAIVLMSRDPVRHEEGESTLASLLGHEGERGPRPGAVAAGTGNGVGGVAAGTGTWVIAVGVAAGLAIGAFYVLISRASADAGLWPLVASRSTAFVFYLIGGLAARRPLLPPRRTLRPAVSGAVLDAVGTALYLLAVQRGPLMLIAVLTSLYPASTVLLATLVLGEHLRGARLLGLVSATAAVLLIVSG